MQRGLPFLGVLWSDLRYAVRQLWKSPGFTLTTLLTGIGVSVGTVLAFALARLSANLLFGVHPDDPGVFVSIIAAITAIAFLVSWGPARRAASIDPVRTLRTE